MQPRLGNGKCFRLLHLGVGFLLVGSFGCASLSEVHRKSNPTPRESMVGTWIGLTEDEAYFYRLTLEEDGTGVCGTYFFYAGKISFYRIRWTYLVGKHAYGDLKVEVENDAPEHRGDLVTLSGKASHWRLLLTAHGKRWSRELLLWNEATFERAREELEQRIE